MRIKVLIDNIEYHGLKGEWGLSIYIEHEGRKILLDAGETGAFADNAAEMGVDLSAVDFAVLSHAHYDHADGFGRFFEINKRAKLYLRSCCRENCFGEHDDGIDYIGIHEGYLNKYADRLVYVNGDYEISDGISLVPHKTSGLEKIAEKVKLYQKKDGNLCPDCFDHEQSLVIRTGRGIVIFNSCSHGGADNIIREVSATYRGEKVAALIGGFHLYKSSDDEVRAFAQRVRDTGIELIVTGHCTGDAAMVVLKEELGDIAHQMYSGFEIEI